MKSCVIVCAGGFNGFLKPIGQEDYILAADGGYAHLQAMGIKANEVLGDFDSLGYVPENSQLFPKEKDDTDAMLAVRRGLALGYRQFFLYGCLDGPRLDHTVANFQTLQFLADNGATGYLIGKDYIVTVVKNGQLRFPASAEGVLSVFCMGKDAKGVTLKGLQYNISEETLTAGFPLGVSNRFIREAACVAVTDGSLLVMYDRGCGLPDREEQYADL